MCEIGDLIVVYNPKANHRPIGKHTFVVLDDTNGIVSGMFEYDFISLLLTSYADDDKDRHDKLQTYEGNMHISKDDKIITDPQNDYNKNSYVQANNFFYFEKSKIAYRKIGRIETDVFNLIIEFIQELNSQGISINRIIDKAKKIEDADT